MQYAINLNGGHGSALNGRQEHAAQRIAQSQTKATLQRLGNDTRFARFIMTGNNIQFGGLNQFMPVFLDHNVTSSISYRNGGLMLKRDGV